MVTRPRFRSAAFPLLMAFALIAMTVRAAVPLGFMLTADKDRWVVVTLCSGAGPMQMALNLDTGEQRLGGDQPAEDEPSQPTVHAPCVFAAAVAVAPPRELLSAPVPRHGFVLAAQAFPASVAIGNGLAAPRPWATGPPLSA